MASKPIRIVMNGRPIASGTPFPNPGTSMNHHRFAALLEPARLPQSTPATSPGGFVACPLALGMVGGACWAQQQVYQWAFAQAQAVVRPSLLERAWGLNRN